MAERSETAPARSRARTKRAFNFNTAAALAFAALAVLLIVSVPSQIAKPKLFMGRAMTALEPTLFPYLVGGGLLILSLWYLLQSLRLSERHLFVGFDRARFAKTSISVGVFLAYALLMEPLGFVAASALMLAVLTTFYGNRNVVLGAAVSVGFPVAVYWLFTRALHVYLPEAPWL